MVIEKTIKEKAASWLAGQRDDRGLVLDRDGNIDNILLYALKQQNIRKEEKKEAADDAGLSGN